MSKPFVVISDGLDASLFAEFKQHPQLEVYPEAKISQDKLKELLPKTEGIIIRSATKMTQEMIDLAPRLKYIIRAGEGTDNIDKEYCKTKGIAVSNTPGANSNAVAELAIGLMLSLYRKIPFAQTSMYAKKWEKELFKGMELTGKTIGFAGFGKIGQLVARRLAAFEVKVLFYDVVTPQHGISYASQVANLEELFKQSDIISIHLPKLPSTTNIINKDLLNLMKSDAIIINTSRGGIINEDDLYEVLKNRTIQAAALDVYNQEPLNSDSKLLTLDNLVLTPHVGASSKEAQFRVGQMAVKQMSDFLLEGKLSNSVL